MINLNGNKSSYEEHDVAATETYSQSDDEYDGDDDYDELQEEDEQQPFWRQHLPAILIAFVAAIAGHVYNNLSSRNTWYFPSQSTIKHAYLEDYVRTANITFCQNLPASDNKHISVMDFFIPQEYYSTLIKYYQADEVQDDMYEAKDYDHFPTDPEFECLQGQHTSNPKRKFKGSTYYYKVCSTTTRGRGNDALLFYLTTFSVLNLHKI
jgi:hypothetical protein